MKTFCLKNSDENVVNAKGEQTVRAIMRSTGFIFFYIITLPFPTSLHFPTYFLSSFQPQKRRNHLIKLSPLSH